MWRRVTGMAGAMSCLALAAMSTPAWAQRVQTSEQATFEVVEVASGINKPWSVAFLPDGRFLVTEKSGTLRIVSAAGSVSDPLDGVPKVVARGQGGLLDVVLHPDFEVNRLAYFSYVGGTRRLGTMVARARLGDSAVENWEVLFTMRPRVDTGRHFGSRMAFAEDGTLYVSFGDRGRRAQAQDAGNHVGTVIRINDDGSLPPDNPFIDSTAEKAEVFSYGHRNVQGLARHPETGAMWAHEHGPKGGDEVNILRPGANYGWPEITYGTNYDGSTITAQTTRDGMEDPVVYWVPSIAPSGMAFYVGDRMPEWRGDLFVGALRGRHLRRLELDGDRVVGEERLLVDLRHRVRDVRSGPDGYLYVLTDDSNGKLLRLEPA